MNKKIYLSAPYLFGKEQAYLQEALASGWLAPAGDYLTKFEDTIAQKSQMPFCLAVSSGTAALHLAFRLLGIDEGDEVICPTLTFVGSINPILYLGAKPVFVDSEYQTWNICPDTLAQVLERKKREHKLPKAILVVHLFGQAAQMDKLIPIAQHYQIPIVEDAAEALGASYQEKPLGSWGDLSIYSFNGNKIITTSAGGALLCSQKAQYEKAAFWASQAKENAPHYQHQEMGYNYRLSNVLAALGQAQLVHLSEAVAKKRAIWDFYQQQLEALPISFWQEPTHHFTNAWLSVVLFKDEQTRERLRLWLAKNQIESRPVWKPMHLQPLFAKAEYYGEKVAADLFARGLCLPSGLGLQKEDLERIVQLLKKVI